MEIDSNENTDKRAARRPKWQRDFLAASKENEYLLDRNIKDGYFKAIMKLAIVFRVFGTLWDFKAQGPERLWYF